MGEGETSHQSCIHVDTHAYSCEGTIITRIICNCIIHSDSHAVTHCLLVGIYYTGPIKYHADQQTLLLAAGSRVVAAYEAYGDMRRDKFRTTWPLGPKRPEGPPASWDRSQNPNFQRHKIKHQKILPRLHIYPINVPIQNKTKKQHNTRHPLAQPVRAIIVRQKPDRVAAQRPRHHRWTRRVVVGAKEQNGPTR